MRVIEVKCDLCGGRESEVFAQGTDYEYQTTLDAFLFRQCCDCGHVYLNPRPADSELGSIYPSTYYSYVQRENERGSDSAVGRLRTKYHCGNLRAAFGDLVGGTGPTRVLDVGCGDGRFLDLMRLTFGEAIETYGIDFDEQAVKDAEQKGHQTQLGTFEEADYPSGFFHIIYISHVIEHLPSPRQFLERSNDLLAWDGAVHIETPNINCAEAGLFRQKYWGGYHFPRHWNLFTPETIARLSGECGFQLKAVRYGSSPVFLNRGMHLTPETPTYSMRGCGGLPADAGGV